MNVVDDFFYTHYNPPIIVVEASDLPQPVVVKVTPPNPSDFAVVYTDGNSVVADKLIGFPDGVDRFELCGLIPKSLWNPTEKSVPNWAYSLLLRLSSYVQRNELVIKAPLTFLEFPAGALVIPKRSFSGVFLMLHEQVVKSQEHAINIISVHPVFDIEIAYEKEMGAGAFFEMLDDGDVPRHIDIDRLPAIG